MQMEALTKIELLNTVEKLKKLSLRDDTKSTEGGPSSLRFLYTSTYSFQSTEEANQNISDLSLPS